MPDFIDGLNRCSSETSSNVSYVEKTSLQTTSSLDPAQNEDSRIFVYNTQSMPRYHRLSGDQYLATKYNASANGRAWVSIATEGELFYNGLDVDTGTLLNSYTPDDVYRIFRRLQKTRSFLVALDCFSENSSPIFEKAIVLGMPPPGRVDSSLSTPAVPRRAADTLSYPIKISYLFVQHQFFA